MTQSDRKGSSAVYKCDVVIVGGGASGLSAAIMSVEAGADTVLIEKNPSLGGSTAWSVGSWTASGTQEQRSAGIEDSTGAHFEDLGKCAGPLVNRDNLELRRILAEHTPAAIEWAKALGVRFHGPFPEPPHRVPRMHIVLPNARSYIYHLEKRARLVGVHIRLGLRAMRIDVEGDRVLAIIAEDAGGQPVTFRPRRGAVLAGGDYSNGSEMKRQLAGPHVADVPGVNPTASGDCQKLVTDIGGEVVNGDLVLGPLMRFPLAPNKRLVERLPPWTILTGTMKWALEKLPSALIRPFVIQFVTAALGPERSLFQNGAKLVNKDGVVVEIGERTAGQAVAAQPNKEAFAVFDDTVAKLYSKWPNFISTAPSVAYAYLQDYRRARPDLYYRAPDLTDLARQLRIPAAGLIGSIGGAGPFHALGPIKAVVVLTDGGVRVDETLAVRRKDGSTIVNLFAAGSTGQGGLLLEGHGHHIGWAFVSGRLAGKNVAKIK